MPINWILGHKPNNNSNAWRITRLVHRAIDELARTDDQGQR